MKNKYCITINHLKVNSSKDVKQYALEIMDHPYTDENGWGYADVIRNNNILYATLQKLIPTNYYVWNPDLQQIEQQLVKIIKEIRFEIDFEHELLLVDGTNTQLNYIKQSFRQIFWNEFIYEPIKFLPVDYILILNKLGLLISIDEITIKDFQYDGCLIGRYTAKPIHQLGIIEKLAENCKNIIHVKVKFLIDEEECILSVNNSNVMNLESSEEAEEKFLHYIKNNI